MKMPPILYLGLFILSAPFFLPEARAAILFSYDSSNSYVTANQSFRNADGTTWTSGNRPFSQTAALSPGTGYTGPSFIGGFSGTVGSISTAAVDNNSALGDVADVHLAGTAAGASFNWLLGGSFSSINLPAVGSAFSVNLGAQKSSGGTVTVRLALYDGTQWYISDTSSVASNSGSFTASFTNVQNFTWELYDPTTNLAFSGNSALTPSLTNVTAFGILNFYTGIGANTRGETIETLTVAVPEPGAAGLVAIGALTLSSLHLRRRKFPLS